MPGLDANGAGRHSRGMSGTDYAALVSPQHLPAGQDRQEAWAAFSAQPDRDRAAWATEAMRAARPAVSWASLNRSAERWRRPLPAGLFAGQAWDWPDGNAGLRMVLTTGADGQARVAAVFPHIHGGVQETMTPDSAMATRDGSEAVLLLQHRSGLVLACHDAGWIEHRAFYARGLALDFLLRATAFDAEGCAPDGSVVAMDPVMPGDAMLAGVVTAVAPALPMLGMAVTRLRLVCALPGAQHMAIDLFVTDRAWTGPAPAVGDWVSASAMLQVSFWSPPDGAP